MEKVYKIHTTLTEKTSKEIESKFEKEDRDLVSYVNHDIYIDVIENDGLISIYIACSDSNLKKILSLFYKYSVKFTIEDITTSFLRGSEKVEDVEFQKYLAENLSIDDVLDKISEMGIDSLSDIDRKVLKG